MSYWTLNDFLNTRKKIKPLSRFWGEKEKDDRQMIFQCIDNMVLSLASIVDAPEIEDLDFAAL